LATLQVVKHFNQSGVLLKGLLNNFQRRDTSEKLIPHSMFYSLRADIVCPFFILDFTFTIHTLIGILLLPIFYALMVVHKAEIVP